MIEDAEKLVRLNGDTIVEPTSGNTVSVSLGLVPVKGYKVVIVMPGHNVLSVKIIQAYGAESCG